MVQTIAFRKTKDEFGWLSNMSPHSVTHQGHHARTAEHLFQSLRFGLDSEEAGVVLACTSPMSAKLTAKALVRDRGELIYKTKPRSGYDLLNMALVVGLKVDQYPALAERLRATGDAHIIEDTSFRPRPDVFWGARRYNGLDLEPSATPDPLSEVWMVQGGDPQGWIGENHLGRTWMVRRHYISTPRML